MPFLDETATTPRSVVAMLLKGQADCLRLMTPEVSMTLRGRGHQLLGNCVARLGSITPDDLARDYDNTTALLIAIFDTITAIVQQVGTQATQYTCLHRHMYIDTSATIQKLLWILGSKHPRAHFEA
jgi:hypothetical protein